MNRWKDVWLNEGPAIHSELLWEEREGVATVQEAFEAMWAEIPADDPFWRVVIGDPGVADMWADAVFFRDG